MIRLLTPIVFYFRNFHNPGWHKAEKAKWQQDNRNRGKPVVNFFQVRVGLAVLKHVYEAPAVKKEVEWLKVKQIGEKYSDHSIP